MNRLLMIWCVWMLSTLQHPVAKAQGLLWNLPEDGVWVRYEGTYSQSETKPNSPTGKVEIPPWVEHLWIKSVGKIEADFRGKPTPCRWIEIKLERGRERDGRIDTGIAGAELFKLLIPEEKVISDPVDAAGVPVHILPIAKGFRKTGDGEPKMLSTTAFQPYPSATVIGYYRNVDVGPEEDFAAGLKTVRARKLVGKSTSERPSSRTVIESTVWTTREIPFGLAGWQSRIVRETKGDFADRSEFIPATEVIVEMKFAETGTDAQSEVEVPAE